MQKFLYLILILIALVFINGCGLSEDTVAEVGDISISVDEFKNELQRRYPDKASFSDVDSTSKKNILDRMIQNKLKLAAAYDMGIDHDEVLMSDLRLQIERLLNNKYYEVMIVDKMISEEDLKEAFDVQKEEVKASHILISFKGARGGKSQRSKEEARNLAVDLVKQAQEGTDFAELASKHSEDPSASKNKGDLGYFTWGRMVPEFQEAAFAMEVGQVSDPVETSYGFHVIKVTDKRENPNFAQMEYKKEVPEIKRRLYFARQKEGMELWETHRAEIKEKMGYKLLTDNVKEAAAFAKKKMTENNLKPENFTDAELELALAEIDGENYTFADMFKEYGKDFNRAKARITEYMKLAQEIENIVLKNYIVKQAYDLGLDEMDDVRDQIKDLTEKRMISVIEQKEVREKAQATDEEMLEYYEKHREEFVVKPQIELWEIFVKNENTAKSIHRKVKAGQNFEKLAERYTEDKVYKTKKGYVGFKEENRRGSVSREAFKLGENAIGGPVKYRNGFTVFKTGKLKPKEYESFEAAKNKVKSKVNRDKVKDRRQAWKDEIEAKYTVNINEPVLYSI